MYEIHHKKVSFVPNQSFNPLSTMSTEAKKVTATEAVKNTKRSSKASAIKLRFKIDVSIPAKEGVIKVADCELK